MAEPSRKHASRPGFDAAMRNTRVGGYEYQVQAELEAGFRKLGSPRNGYPSIVASGGNSCTLHYVTNRAQMKDGDLLLIDAGAEVGYYTADITRTWPVNTALANRSRLPRFDTLSARCLANSPLS